MAAPFDLPDTCDIYLAFGTDPPIAEDVPCRQVPRFQQMMTPHLYETEVRLGITHWVDFEDDVYLIDYSTQLLDGMAITASTNQPSLVFTLADTYLVLDVVWVEDRWSNTPKSHQRAYCVRRLRIP